MTLMRDIRAGTGLEGIDVETLVGRRAVGRWERTSVGDLFERVRWSTPDKEAIIGRPGSCLDRKYARLTYSEADDLANRIANALLDRGLSPGRRLAANYPLARLGRVEDMRAVALFLASDASGRITGRSILSTAAD